MRYGLFAVALTAFVAFSAPALAGCYKGHTTTADSSTQSTVADSSSPATTKPSGS